MVSCLRFGLASPTKITWWIGFPRLMGAVEFEKVNSQPLPGSGDNTVVD